MHDNILLINPRINPKSQNKIINEVINTMFPIGLGVLAAVLESSGIKSVSIIDEQIHPIKDKDLDELISSLRKPRIIGFSVLTINSARAYALAESIKRIAPDALIVFGGIHPTVLPQEAFTRAGVDVVVSGEGEEAFKELVISVINQQDYKNIQGLSFKKDGKVIHNPKRPLIGNLDILPPFPYHLFEKDKDKYSSFGSILTSRGCPYSCVFCSSRSISGNSYRYFSVERVISEMSLLVEKYNQKTIGILDDNISGNRKHFLELLDGIIKEGLNKKTSFHASMRGDNLTEELLDKAKLANFKMISFGLETGSESLMKMINKGETVGEVAQAIRMTDKKGIAAATTIIFGLPNETRKDRRDTMMLVKSLPLSSVRFNTLSPYPGTPIFDKLNKEGKLFIRKDWSNFAVQYLWEGDDLPYVPANTRRYELLFDTMLANLSFYLSPRGIKRMLRSSFAGGNVISLNNKIYLFPKTMFKLSIVFLYLIKRFIYVIFMMLFQENQKVAIFKLKYS